MNHFRAAPAGLLRINATRAAVPTQLGPRLARFLHAHPDVRVELTENDGLVDIVAEGYDAGVRLHEFVPEDMVAVPMGPPLRGLIVGSPDYLRRRPAPQHPRDLAAHECIRFRFASGHLYKWQFERGGQALEIDVPGRLTLCEQGTIVRAVLDGIGLAYVLEDTARPYIDSGQMVAVLEDWSEPFAGFALYYPKQRQMPARCGRSWICCGRSGGRMQCRPTAGTHPNRSCHQRVVAFATELDQAEAVAEWIGQHGDAPATLAHGLLECRPGCNRTCQRGVDVIHHPVQVQRGPVALVVAHVAVFGGGAASLVLQQVERCWPTEQFHGPGPRRRPMRSPNAAT